MSLKVILVACVAAVALADKAPVHLPPVYVPTYHAPEPVYHAPAHYKEPEYPTVPPKYNYNYGVVDGYSGIFKYVDNGDGLVAEVTYEGEAQYPEYKPTYNPAPYHAAPKYPVY
ncbi:proline-rich 33 kDa extensin-related protein-like [Penaeus chinensis]|uniref:proline-rich 33 kDa extensin-related protein-like n=1 Tax=Penaeus chinensis TaxID=139456 RepID=UPI001FB79E72|nr:proline-rich 33 kDa extensin-related protein-like [Penaeus chinensis]